MTKAAPSSKNLDEKKRKEQAASGPKTRGKGKASTRNSSRHSRLRRQTIVQRKKIGRPLPRDMVRGNKGRRKKKRMPRPSPPLRSSGPRSRKPREGKRGEKERNTFRFRFERAGEENRCLSPLRKSLALNRNPGRLKEAKKKKKRRTKREPPARRRQASRSHDREEQKGTRGGGDNLQDNPEACEQRERLTHLGLREFLR